MSADESPFQGFVAGDDPTVPHLCERCWFPILPGETARRTPVHVTGATFTARLICFVHTSPPCTAQDPEESGETGGLEDAA